MNVLLLLSHSIEEYDQVRLLSELGYDVFSIGAYSEPGHPGEDKRPPLPNAPDHPELREACDERRAQMLRDVGEPGRRVDWAKAFLPQRVLDWADTVIVHHLEHTWLVPQWNRLREKRVIWRTVGQSVENNERMMAPLVRDGLQVVRYSPKERNIPGYCGESTLIRFYKDPNDWGGWVGDKATVLNITQNLKSRHPYTNYEFWADATKGLPATPVGPGSETIGGVGDVDYDTMRWWLQHARAYLYTGTQPASYTLGLIEALMTGIPVVSIGPKYMTVFPYGPDLFEGHELTLNDTDDPNEANAVLSAYIENRSAVGNIGELQRERAIETFGRDKIARQWADFLG